MDLLGHVNNVAYLDYLGAARENLFAGHPAATAGVVRHQVEFVQPLVFHRHPVLVDTWVTAIADDEVTLTQEVYDDPAVGESQRTTYLRATTVLAHRLNDAERALAEQTRGPALDWRPVIADERQVGDVMPLASPRADVDAREQARSGVFFEYFQEARLQYLMNMHARGERWSQHVVARTDIDFLARMLHRQEPCTRGSVTSAAGRSRSARKCETASACSPGRPSSW